MTMGLYLNGGVETATELPGESVEAIENERMLGSFSSIKDQIKASNGLISASMGQLRNVHGVARLGPHVCNRISEELRSAGIGHQPERLPSSQKALVRLFLLDSPMARLFSDLSTITPEADRRLSELVNDQALHIIEKLNELLSYNQVEAAEDDAAAGNGQ